MKPEGVHVKIDRKEPARQFTVGRGGDIVISDCGTVELQPDEQVTFVTENGSEFDVARKDFGYYATPSLNGRLPTHGLRPALVRNAVSDHYFVLLVEPAAEDRYRDYLRHEALDHLMWLDDPEALARLSALAKE